MITIHTTQKLYAKLPVALRQPASGGALPAQRVDTAASPPACTNPLSGWHANLLTLQRRNCVLLVHDATRFPLFLKGLLKADFAHFDPLFADALMNTLLKLDANQSQLDAAAALLAPCRFDTDCNRSVQGTLNQMAGDLKYMLYFDAARLEEISTYGTAAWLADRPCTVKGQKDCLWPERAMLALLDRVSDTAQASEPLVQN